MKLIEVIQPKTAHYQLSRIELIVEPETSEEAKFLRDKAKSVYDFVNYTTYHPIMDRNRLGYKFDYSIGRYDCYGCWIKEWEQKTHRSTIVIDYFKDMLRGYLAYSKDLSTEELQELIKDYHIFELEAEAEFASTQINVEYENLNSRYKLFLNTCIKQNPDSTILVNLLNKLK